MSTPPPGGPAPLVVRYHRGLGIASALAGVLMLGLSAGTGNLLDVFIGLVLLALGIGYVLGKALVLTHDEVQVRSPIGITTRRLPVSGPADLRMDGRTLRHGPQDTKVVTLGFGVDKGDVERLRAAVGPDRMG